MKNHPFINVGLSLFAGLLFTIILGSPSKAEVHRQPLSNLTVKELSACRNKQLLYTVILQVKDLKVSKYLIERQEMGKPSSRVKILEWTYEEMAQNKFQYIDFAGLVKHGRYQYFLRTIDQSGKDSENGTINALVKNIPFQDNTVIGAPIVTQNNAVFTLGPKVDLESDALEYRLYTRVPGGGGEKIYQSWSPQTDNQQVIVNFKDTCEFKLVCIESNPTIPDRSESVLLNWTMFH